MEHIHKEPRKWFWDDFFMSIFAPSMVIFFFVPIFGLFILKLLKMVDDDFMNTPEPAYYIISVIALVIVVSMIMSSIRGVKIKRGNLLKIYPDGCMKVGCIFWKKGGTVHEINLPESAFKKGEKELTKEVSSKLVWKEDHVNVFVPVAIEIQTFAFDVKEYYYKIVLPQKKTFEDLAKEVFESSLDTTAIKGALSSFADEKITKKELLKQLSRIVTFDENFFSNIVGAKITFGDPVFQACTGTLCSVPAKAA